MCLKFGVNDAAAYLYRKSGKTKEALELLLKVFASEIT